MSAVLEVKNLRAGYADREILKGVSFTLEPDDFFAIIGPSGAGKSTLIRCVNRLVEPSGGEILLQRRRHRSRCRCAELRAVRRNIGMIFQEFNLIERLSVIDNVLTGRLGYTGTLRSLFRAYTKADIEQALRLLDRVGLSEHIDKRADRLSGGQRQRVGIARALIQNPRLLLVDEPTSSLDPKISREVMGLIREMAREFHIPVLCNIHDVDLALRLLHPRDRPAGRREEVRRPAGRARQARAAGHLRDGGAVNAASTLGACASPRSRAGAAPHRASRATAATCRDRSSLVLWSIEAIVIADTDWSRIVGGSLLTTMGRFLELDLGADSRALGAGARDGPDGHPGDPRRPRAVDPGRLARRRQHHAVRQDLLRRRSLPDDDVALGARDRLGPDLRLRGRPRRARRRPGDGGALDRLHLQDDRRGDRGRRPEAGRGDPRRRRHPVPDPAVRDPAADHSGLRRQHDLRVGHQHPPLDHPRPRRRRRAGAAAVPPDGDVELRRHRHRDPRRARARCFSAKSSRTMPAEPSSEFAHASLAAAAWQQRSPARWREPAAACTSPADLETLSLSAEPLQVRRHPGHAGDARLLARVPQHRPRPPSRHARSHGRDRSAGATSRRTSATSSMPTTCTRSSRRCRCRTWRRCWASARRSRWPGSPPTTSRRAGAGSTPSRGCSSWRAARCTR